MLSFSPDEVEELQSAGVFVLLGTDPRENLAIEQTLFETIEGHDSLLLFYVNDAAVVCGKHQNIWFEGNIPWLVENTVPILRRMSGGGTVYHDLGNLNYSFLGPRYPFDQRDNLEFLSRVLEDLGICVEITPRGDLLSEGRKFSGNALWYKKDRVMHHGTLLVDADRQRMRTSLDGLKADERYALTGHWVDSNPQKVVNLREMNPEISPEKIISWAAHHWREKKARKNEKQYARASRTMGIETLLHTYGSWEWTFGKTHEFSCRVTNEDESLVLKVVGGLGVEVTLEKGGVETSLTFGEAFIFGGKTTLDFLNEGMPWDLETLNESRDILNSIGKKSYGEEIVWISNSF